MSHAGAPLLVQSTPLAVCRILAHWLDRAEGASQRLRGGEDPEALHDFRVGLRRTRASLKSYRGSIGDAVPKKLRHGLRDLAHASTLARDTEVQLAWLAEQKTGMRSHERAGYRWLMQYLAARLDGEYAMLRARVDADFAPLLQKLRQRLEFHAKEAGPPLAVVAAQVLETLVAELGEGLSRFAASGDPALIHPPRLVAKQARYLLDPVSDEVAAAPAAVRELTALQDRLGEIHDRQVLQQELKSAIEAAGAARFRAVLDFSLKDAGENTPQLRHARRSSESAGIVAIALRAQSQEQAMLAALRDWIESGRHAALIEQLAAVRAAVLAAADVAAPPPESVTG